jgi:hypothetical protein
MPLTPNPDTTPVVYGICPGCNTQIEPHEVIESICRCGDNHPDNYDELAKQDSK